MGAKVVRIFEITYYWERYFFTPLNLKLVFVMEM